MRAYQFVVRDNSTEAEKLGVMGLPNDAEALDFGRHVAHGLIEYGNGTDYAGCTVDITEGARAVSSIAVE